MEHLLNLIFPTLMMIFAFVLLWRLVGLLARNIHSPKTSIDTVTSDYEYQPIRKLVTSNELTFYQALIIVTKGKHTVFTKVRIADLMTPKKGAHDKKTWWRAFNAIAKKHVDFVLCDPLTLEVKCLIELDDSTHNRPDRIARDKLVDMAAASAGIELKHFKVKNKYDYFELEKELYGLSDTPEPESIYTQ
ncbi:DUF2726 domain-containing protein [Vibrio crassostreae]|uniref:DUF2726 domain-containing protein n=1 Tax=Vibrio crassostreae TaxID=246167 RepID=UPI000366524E|nr:DUF2726 domain-containing protein [Vibrio crassostreae]OED70988.1 hypothetical protein A141_11100 [Vibrio crassostreae ZF-91]